MNCIKCAIRFNPYFITPYDLNYMQVKDNRVSRPFHKIPRRLLWGILCTVIIGYCYVFYSNFVKPYSYRWKALYGEVKYPKGTVRGLDVSHYQNDINWIRLKKDKIQNSPISFVFIKATEGSDGIDPTFHFNFNKAKECGFIRGAYHFFTTQSSGFDQAVHFCNNVHLEDGDLPPVLDVEVDMEMSSLEEKTLNELINWLTVVENHYRVKPIIYASYRFKTKYLNAPIFNDYPYWVAHYYVDSLEYEGKWNFWQHTDAGHVDGIDGYVDLDLFNGNAEMLSQMCISKYSEK